MEHTLAELQRADIGRPFAEKYAGEPPLALAECLAMAKGKLNLCLDAKSIDPERLARDILKAGMERQVVIYGTPANLKRIHDAAPGKLALMLKWLPSVLDPEAWTVSNHLAAVEIDANELTPDTARMFHELKIKVQAKVLGEWDQANFWDQCLAAKADWLQTDLPEEIVAREVLRRMPKRPVLFGLHRGANRYAPENTLPAFEKGIRLGADFLEFDVRTTSDGKFYLLHDSGLEGKTDGHGPIANTPSSAIEKLSAGVGFGRPFAQAGLPSLDRFLACAAGKVNLYFDAKAISPEALAQALERHGATDRTAVYQSLSYLVKLKLIDPRIRAMPPLDSGSQLEELHAKLSPYAVDAKWSILSRDLIARCHALGILVFSDALGNHETVEDYLQAMEWGIDLIQTDHPMRLLRAMELRLMHLGR